MPFKYNGDGLLDLYFQNKGHATTKKLTGFPRRSRRLTMRLCSPQLDALTGKWNPPPVKKSRSGLAAIDATEPEAAIAGA
jgi:hypothetical protein